MAKARPAPALEPHEALQAEISELRTEVANLRAFVQIANEIFEGIREDLQWLTQNGIEIREPIGRLHPIPVLKGMALDPAGDDWGEKLVINHGHLSAEPNAVTKHSQDSSQCVEPTTAAEPHHPQSLTTAKAERPRDRLF